MVDEITWTPSDATLGDWLGRLNPCGLLRVPSDGPSAAEMTAAGLWEVDTLDGARYGVKPFSLPKIQAVMSAPRLAFSANMQVLLNLCYEHRIPIEISSGAYWAQHLERRMDAAIETGAEWVLSLDYDTLVTPAHFQRLLRVFAQYPECDALAPIQCKRDNSQVLFCPLDENGNRRRTIESRELDEVDIYPVETAHFGMTLFRASALADLKRPKFREIPNDDGRWLEGRTDADIYFWEQFRAQGKKAFIATHVSVGHLQLVATWPDDRLHPIHQYATDFMLNGAPKDIRH